MARPLHILFVCTGNTCRSPMAQAMAPALLREQGVEGSAASAGVGAAEGVPPSLEAVEAMRARGLDITGLRSRPVTPEMVSRADLVLCMTASHAQAVAELAGKDDRGKIMTLDDERDIDDPIGSGPETYRACAEQIGAAITRRIREYTT